MPRRTAEEAAIDEQLKKEREANDLDIFLDCYERATGVMLQLEEEAEDPDFICSRTNGALVGVELTGIRRSPVDALWQDILDGRTEMDPDDACDELWRLVEQKAEKISNYRTKHNILLLQNFEANYRALCARAIEIPIEDFARGFVEIWLGDYFDIRKGTHREISLLGLYPEEIRVITERSERDKKAYR